MNKIDIVLEAEYRRSPFLMADKSHWINFDEIDVSLSKDLAKDLFDWVELFSEAVEDGGTNRAKVANQLKLDDAYLVTQFNERGLALLSRLQSELKNSTKFELIGYIPVRPM